MASTASTPTAAGEIRFSADFVANIPSYERAIRRHRVMSWARQRSLDDDLVQLTLVDLARVDAYFDPQRASSPHHFRLAVLGSRVSDSYRLLMRLHREVTGVIIDELDSDIENAIEDARVSDLERDTDDPVVDAAIRAQAARMIVAAIAHLASRQREVIELALEDRSDKEIASRFGVSVQSANKTRLAAIANLKRVLVAEFPNN